MSRRSGYAGDGQRSENNKKDETPPQWAGMDRHTLLAYDINQRGQSTLFVIWTELVPSSRVAQDEPRR